MPTDLGSSHDIVQILFWFVVVLGSAFAGAGAWIAKYVVIPVKDAHIEYVKKTGDILPTISQTLVVMSDHLDALERGQIGHEDAHRTIIGGLEKLTDTWRNFLPGGKPPPHGTIG